MLKHLVQSAARSFGYEIRRTASPAVGANWSVDLPLLLRTQSAPVVFDIGANVGQTSTRLAAAFPAPARIFAFEPAAATYAELARAVAPFPHVRSFQQAVGDRPARLRLHHGRNSQLSRFVPVSSVTAESSEEVEVTTVDAVAANHTLERVDLLKSDTEGHDGAVLRGAIGLLRRSAIRAVLAEATFESTGELHTKFSELLALLEPHGFCLHQIYDREHWGIRLKFCNVLFLHEASFPGVL